MKKPFALAMSVVVIWLSGCAHAPARTAAPSGQINWYRLSEGERIAKQEKKPMVVDFASGAGCPRCEAMGKGAYKDPGVISMLNKDFVPIKIDLDKPITSEELALGNRFGFRQDCLLLFLDYNGNPIADPVEGKLCFVDVVNAKDFRKYLIDALRNMNAGK